MKKIIKILYKIIPFKLQIFSILKLIWTPPFNIYQHLHFIGNFRVKIDRLKSFKIRHYGYQVENKIFWGGLANGFEKESIKLWMKLCPNAKVIMDIGANTGIYSLIAKSINPEAKVYAFEPVSRIFKKLKENISLNSLNIFSVEKAISNSDGFATIFDEGTDHIYSVTVNKNLSAPGIKVTETKINTISLNTFIKDQNIAKVDLMKIDVETHEPEVLQGFSKYLSKHRPTMLIEILNDDVGKEVNKLVLGLGYLYFNIDEDGGIRQVSEITKSDYYNYLLCTNTVAKELDLVDKKNSQ